MAPSRSIPVSFAKRLHATRQTLWLTQVELVRLMDLLDEVGHTRASRYEQGKHFPDTPAAEKLAKALGVPLPYLWATDERLAEVILGFTRLDKAQQDGMLGLLREFLSESTSASSQDGTDG